MFSTNAGSTGLPSPSAITIRSGHNSLSNVTIQENVINKLNRGITWWTPWEDGGLSKILIYKNTIRNTEKAIASLEFVDKMTYATNVQILNNEIDTALWGLHITHLASSVIAGNRFHRCQNSMRLLDDIDVKFNLSRTEEDHNHAN